MRGVGATCTAPTTYGHPKRRRASHNGQVVPLTIVRRRSRTQDGNVSVGVLDSCARPFSTTNRSLSNSDERRPPILDADNLLSDAEYPATATPTATHLFNAEDQHPGWAEHPAFGGLEVRWKI